MSSWGNDMSVDMVVATNRDHGSGRRHTCSQVDVCRSAKFRSSCHLGI